MKEINKQKFEERKKSGNYTLAFKFWGKTDKMELFSSRNNKPMKPADMTDEDVIILSQLANFMSEAMGQELCKRDLIPDELKRMYNTNEGEADA